MSKEITLKDSKNYLISVHDALRRTFRNANPEERVFIDSVLEGIETNVKQLEMLEEMLQVWKISKGKKSEMLIEE